MTPLQKGVFFSCIFPLKKFSGIIIYLTDRYFGFLYVILSIKLAAIWSMAFWAGINCFVVFNGK